MEEILRRIDGRRAGRRQRIGYQQIHLRVHHGNHRVEVHDPRRSRPIGQEERIGRLRTSQGYHPLRRNVDHRKQLPHPHLQSQAQLANESLLPANSKVIRKALVRSKFGCFYIGR